MIYRVHRETFLGRELMSRQKFTDAEKIFRTDLERNPTNGRSLAGLRDCLVA